MSDIVEVLARAASDYWLAHGYDPSEPSEDMARALLAAIGAGGYQIVPKEPTPEMYAAADREWNRNTLVVVWQLIYKAMLAAAPKPPSPQAHTASP